MMRKIEFLLYLVSFAFIGLSCSEGEDNDVINLPSDLEVLVNKEANGLVRLSLNATNANFFLVNFGIPESDFVRVNGNEVSNTYTDPGRYNISVQAHASDKEFITSFSIVTFTNAELGIEFPKNGFESPLEYAGYEMV
jgi:hypothetical protein